MPLIAKHPSPPSGRKPVALKKKIVFLTGPTAAGKTAVAVCLAKKLKAEIISCDSMQVYRGMDVITSAPADGLKRKTPYHLTGFIPPSREYNVCRYRHDALIKIKAVFKKNKVPLLVGGTGLYISVLVDGIFKETRIKPGLRRKFYRQAASQDSVYLYRRLEKVDPEAARRIHPNDARRIVRALEVFESTGRPISELQKERKGLGSEYDVRIFALDLPRARLYARIDRRVKGMFRQGAVEEARRLLARKLSRTAGFAIGVREIKGYLDGSYGLEEAEQWMQLNSRHYAKRQLTWLRKDKRVRWIKVKKNDQPADIARRILKEIR